MNLITVKAKEKRKEYLCRHYFVFNVGILGARGLEGLVGLAEGSVAQVGLVAHGWVGKNEKKCRKVEQV